jgi:hypothetical protein
MQLNTIAQTITYTNAPVPSDVNNIRMFDSAGVIPKNIGAGSLWDFGSCSAKTSSLSLTYINASSHSAYSLFSGATIAEVPNNGNYSVLFSKSTIAKNECYGLYDQFSINYNIHLSNPLTINVWPTNLGTSNTDTGSGIISKATNTGVVSGTTSILGSGTGTIILPGGVVFSNILQTKLTQTLIGSVANKTVNIQYITYNYYHSSQKYPLLSVKYYALTEILFNAVAETFSASIQVNNAVLSGIVESNFNASFTLFPNPAKDNFSVNLSNTTNDKGTIEIYNELGQIAKRVELGNESVIKTNVSVADLKPGLYMVKTTIGNRTSTKKLVIQ